MQRAIRYENQIKSQFSTMPNMTERQREDNALVYYGPAAVGVELGRGLYWIPKADHRSWVKNPNHSVATNYVDGVRTLVQ